jgi:hypothetical protein
MLGALEWMNQASHEQAAVDWNRSIEEFEILRQGASKDNHQTKVDWYTEHRAVLCDALSEQLTGAMAKQKPNPKPPGSWDPDNNITGENSPGPIPPAKNEESADLYQDLLGKVLWDRATADRLIEYERKTAPTADRNELIKRAIERWIRDNQ